MRTKCWIATMLLLAVALSSGCIVHDQNTTIVLNQDGSADMTIVRTNIRSTARGDRAAEQIDDFRKALDDQTHDDFQRIADAGATLEMSMWLREQVPMAHVLRTSIPDESSLEKMATLRDADGVVVIAPEFSADGARRRFSLSISIDPDSVSGEDEKGDELEQLMNQRATSISDIRICVAEGEITAERGFRVASDSRSALLDENAIRSLVCAGEGTAEIFIEWEVQLP